MPEPGVGGAEGVRGSEVRNGEAETWPEATCETQAGS